MMQKELFQNIQNALEAACAKFPQITPELSQQLQNSLQTILKELKLVTREEFDTQKQVLLKTRQKLEQLEKKISEMSQDSLKDEAPIASE